MKKIINILLVALVASCAVGCYSSFNDPEKLHVFTDADFDESQLISLDELRAQYNTLFTESKTIDEDLVLRGKVISNDKDGNVYKSLYILDHSGAKSAAIELRMFVSNYVKFPVGTMIYVRLKGLSIADYRGMLSIGYPTKEASNSKYPNYKHTNIEGRIVLDEHILKGEKLAMESRDTLVVNSSNYTTLTDADLARLVRFEGVESAFGSSSWGYKNSYPNYFADVEDQFEWSQAIADEVPELNPAPMAFVGQNPELTYNNKTELRYSGSSWYTYNRSGSDNSKGQYVIRASAYSRFRAQAIPANGTKVDITAIYTRYTNSSNYAPNTSYQIVPCSGTDIQTSK